VCTVGAEKQKDKIKIFSYLILCFIIQYSPCDVSSVEGAYEPLHVTNIKAKKHQMGVVIQVHSALGIQNPMSGLRPHDLLVTFSFPEIKTRNRY